MDFREQLMQKTTMVNEIIACYLPEEEGYQKQIFEALNYSILAGGKRIRPVIILEAYRMFSENKEDLSFVKPFIAAMEMIHTYSLVHDDLPAMDNDRYRRGKLTTHAKYGEAIGVLAGDALLNYAFETVSEVFHLIEELSEEEQLIWYPRCSKAFAILAKSAGIYGMIGGQVVDVQEAQKKDAKMLDFIYDLKTGALLRASFEIGAVLAGATKEKLEILNTAAYDLGLAFQVQDDILDVTSTFEELGKPVGSDEKNEKTTYVTLYGIEESRQIVSGLTKNAIAQFEKLNRPCDFFISFAKYLETRNK